MQSQQNAGNIKFLAGFLLGIALSMIYVTLVGVAWNRICVKAGIITRETSFDFFVLILRYHTIMRWAFEILVLFHLFLST